MANEIRERAESRRVKQIKMYEKAQKKMDELVAKRNRDEFKKIGQGLGTIFEEDSYPIMSQVTF